MTDPRRPAFAIEKMPVRRIMHVIMRPRDPQFRNRCLVYAGLALVTLAVYLPVLYHGFVEYDDQQYVTDNPQVQAGLTWHGLIWAFGFHAGNWHPLAWLSHMLDCQLYGAQAGGHHLTSLLLHVAGTLLLFSVMNRMTGALWRSAAVAALFAWHPLHVESVAWVAERKDVLCAFFWMLTLWLYVRYADKTSAGRYLLTLGSFALCLMAKPMAVTLPFVLLLLDYWPLARVPVAVQHGAIIRRLLLEKIPFLALVVGGCVLTLHAQQIAIVSAAGLPVSSRLAHTLVAYDHYFWAMFYPVRLAVYYPYVLNLAVGTVVFAGSVVGLVTLLAVIYCRSRPWLIVGWLWFLGTLVPVIGLVQVGDQAWADRYTYLPLIGLFVPLVWLTAELIKNALVLRALAVTASLTLLAATSLQLTHWKNTWTLFDHANRVTEDNYMAVTVLASQLAQQGKLDEAMALYHQALSYKPTFPEAHFFLGNAFDKAGRLDDAVAEYEKALWFKPTQEQTHIFLGIVLGKQKKYEAAITNYQAALVLNPDSAVTHNNLARIYHTQGRFDDAIGHYRTALALNPKLDLAHNNLGILLMQKGDFSEGTRQLREALLLKPGDAETEYNLALALNRQAQWSEAAGLFQKSVSRLANDPKAHNELAVALSHLGKLREARSEFASALLLLPDYPDALDGLAWILATAPAPEFRNGPEAVNMAARACELTHRLDPAKLKTLAATYAETGQFELALATLQTACELALAAKLQPLANECAAMLPQFKAGKPWRSQ